MHPSLALSSIDILGGNAWSYAAIPLIYIFMLLIRSGCLALFNVSVFAWLRERERAAGRGGRSPGTWSAVPVTAEPCCPDTQGWLSRGFER